MGEIRKHFGDALAALYGEAPEETSIGRAVAMLQQNYPRKVVEEYCGLEDTRAAIASDPELMIRFETEE
jgi:hypothetical protein